MGARGVLLCFSAASMSTAKTSCVRKLKRQRWRSGEERELLTDAVNKSSMSVACARVTPGPGVQLKEIGPGSKPCRMAVATIPPTSCAMT